MDSQVIQPVESKPIETAPSAPVTTQAPTSDERNDLSNFDKLMITINRKKSARTEQNEPAEKQAKSVHWSDEWVFINFLKIYTYE